MDALQKLELEIQVLKSELGQQKRNQDRIRKEMVAASKGIEEKNRKINDLQDVYADIAIRSNYEGLGWMMSSIRSPCELNFDRTKSQYMGITAPNPILAWRPQMPNHFVTSGVNGMVTVRDFNPHGPARVLLEIDAGNGQDNPPIDVVWDLDGARMICLYKAGARTPQVSVINMREGPPEDKIRFLDDKPHSKRLLTCATFLSRHPNALLRRYSPPVDP